MGVTVYTSSLRHDLEDARALIARIDEQLPAEFRGKLQTAADLLTEVENGLIDRGHDA